MRHMKASTVRLFLIILFFSVNAPISAQLRESQLGRGDEWLAWRKDQRDGYVRGYIDGYLGGTSTSCRLADDLFESGKPHTLGDGHKPSDMPSARCLVRRGEFAKFFSD